MSRHRFRFIDFTAVVAVAVAVTYAALTTNIFTDSAAQSQKPEILELDEVLLICAVLLIGLAWAMAGLLRERREISRRMVVEREIRTLAFHDALTDLPNRRQFDAALKAAVAAPPSADASHALLMLDLNGFKRINDVFGHAAGDDVLVHVAARLSRAVRQGDMVARLGGDEFAVLATHIAGAEAATGLALRIIEELRMPVIAGGHEQSVASAIGIALMPQDGNDPAELLRKADIALYRAKELGHSAMRFFEPDMDEQVRERDYLERELGYAIESGVIVPYYQPLVDLGTGEIHEFEALARWTHPKLGLIEPSRFIPVAEDSGLIAPLTKSLLTRACADAATWPANVQLAFNVSPVLLRDAGFALQIMSILARSGLPPQRLELEITESALVRDLEAARETLGVLHDAGVRIALDDFGTGYSSLYHLRNFKLDKIKIDRSFVNLMATDDDSAAIVRALVGLGSGLGLKVTAEGVETEQQRKMLATDGCDQAQGFLYSEAVNSTDALALIGQPEELRSRA